MYWCWLICSQRPACDPWLVSTWVVTWRGCNWWILTKLLTNRGKSGNKIPGCVNRRPLRTFQASQLVWSWPLSHRVIFSLWSPSHLAALAGVDSVVVAWGAVSADSTLQVEHRRRGRKLLLACRQPINYRRWAGGWGQGIYNTQDSQIVSRDAAQCCQMTNAMAKYFKKKTAKVCTASLLLYPSVKRYVEFKGQCEFFGLMKKSKSNLWD